MRFVLVLALTLLPAAAAAQEEPRQTSVQAQLLNQVRELYEQARGAGEQVPADLTSWVKQDIERIGSWEYQVVDVDREPAALAAELNRLGGERWECIWIEDLGKTRRLTLKRPARSYLSKIPLGTLLRLLPSGDG